MGSKRPGLEFDCSLNGATTVRALLVQTGTNLPFFFMARQPVVSQARLIVEASRSHSDTPHSVGLLWTGDQPDAGIPT